MESIHFLNGRFVSEKELLISPRDLGYSRGYAVFDFLVTYQHKPFLLERHIDRLFLSAEAIALPVPWSKEQVSDWVMRTLHANASIPGEKVIRVSISGGSSFTLKHSSPPTILVMVDPHVPCPAEDYKNGVAVRLVKFQRSQPQAKTNNYIEAVRCFNTLQTSNIDELIFHSEGMVREGTRSNIFAKINGRLITPKTNILEGITREVLLNNLDLSIPIIAEDFSVGELRKATEVFITATGKEVMPVTTIDDSAVGNGRVGEVTKEVMKQHHDFVYADLL